MVPKYINISQSFLSNIFLQVKNSNSSDTAFKLLNISQIILKFLFQSHNGNCANSKYYNFTNCKESSGDLEISFPLLPKKKNVFQSMLSNISLKVKKTHFVG